MQYSPEELAVVDLINNYRISNGVDPLLVSDKLSDASAKHSHDMAKYDFFGHLSESSDWFPLNANPHVRDVACGYPDSAYVTENIGAGYDNASGVFAGWQQSPGHNANMLDPNLKVIGVGMESNSTSQYKNYWTTDFGDFVDGTAHENGKDPPPDVTPPTVTITSPTFGADIKGPITVTMTASDLVGVTRVELYANGAWVATDYESPYAIAWDSSTLNPGTYNLEARAYDAAGNVATALITIHVSNDNPVPSTTTTSTTTTTTTGVTTSTTTTTSTSSTSTSTSTTSTTVPAVSFPDVPAGSPFYQPIMALAANGVVAGFSDGWFHPTALLTRAQFAKIIILALGKHTAAIDNAGHPTFSDVPYVGSAYPFDYVEEAAGLKIITGHGDGRFLPGSYVTRLQLALMLVRAGGNHLSKPSAGYSLSFTDVPDYGEEAVEIARFNGILSGKSSGRFDPYNPATRGEVAKMVFGLTNVMRKSN